MNLAYIKHSGLFFLRTPAFPLSDIITEKGSAAEGSVEQKLFNFFQSSYGDASLFVASPVLHAQFLKAIAGRLSNKEQRSLLRSLYKYYIRAHSKSTPFGLFAGFSVGQISGEPSQVVLKSQSDFKKNLRMDFALLFAVYELVAKNKQVKNESYYYCNVSLYELTDGYRYAEYCKTSAGGNKFMLSKIDKTDYLDTILGLCNNGYLYADLVNFLNSKYDVEVDEAEEYLDLLIENQIIVSELFPNTVGEDYLDRLIAKLHFSTDPQIHDLLRQLIEVRAAFAINEVDPRSVVEIIKNLAPNDLQNHIQLDLKVRHTECNLNDSDADLIIGQIKELKHLTRRKITDKLDQFVHRFIQKYGDQEKCLNEVLDPELGIGFDANLVPAPLIEDINFPSPVVTQSSSFTLGKFDSLIFEKYLSSLIDGALTINITRDEMASLGDPVPEAVVAESCAIHGNFLKSSSGSFKFILTSISGPSGSRLLGRFSTHDAELTDFLRKTLALEEQCYPDAVLAEIIYTSVPRSGNVLTRPHLRNYEIPVTGRSILPLSNQLPLQDLMVKVEHGEIILRSKKLNKRVIPRESSAYHPTTGDHPSYVFLSYLAMQDGPNEVKFRWNGLLALRPFLPRVEYRNIILSLARWSIQKKQVSVLMQDVKPEYTVREKIRLVITHYNLPQYVVLVGSNANNLLLDLDDVFAMEILLEAIEKNEMTVLEEVADRFDANTFVSGQEGKYHKNEIIIPLTNDRPIAVKKNNLKNANFLKPMKNYYPGSEYLYFKFYIDPNRSDQLLVGELIALIDKLIVESLITDWYFIRYADPGYHLRVRFINHSDPKKLMEIPRLVPTYLRPYLEDKTISDYQICIYEQEIGTYGSDFIGDMEKIFSIDSYSVIQALSYITTIKDKLDQLRLYFSIAGIRDLLEVFGYDETRSFEFLSNLSHGYFAEFNGDKSLKVQLDIKFRAYKQALTQLLGISGNSYLPASLTELLLQRKIQLFSKFKHMTINGDLTSEHRRRLLERTIHLFLNRVFSGENRKTELLIYSLMKKTFELIIKKGK